MGPQPGFRPNYSAGCTNSFNQVLIRFNKCAASLACAWMGAVFFQGSIASVPKIAVEICSYGNAESYSQALQLWR